jgi:hypothetical protein
VRRRIRSPVWLRIANGCRQDKPDKEVEGDRGCSEARMRRLEIILVATKRADHVMVPAVGREDKGHDIESCGVLRPSKHQAAEHILHESDSPSAAAVEAGASMGPDSKRRAKKGAKRLANSSFELITTKSG